MAFPHRFRSRDDVEAAAFIAASFAFGNVAQIGRFLERLFSFLSPSPHAVLTSPRFVLPPPRSGMRHRFISTAGVGRFLTCVRRAYLEHGSLQALYALEAGRSGGCTEARAASVREGLAAFLAWFRRSWGNALPRERAFMFPDPAKGSACKRHNLFLRWMVREADGVDLGLWTVLSPADLIVPLDTHMARMGRWLGLTGRRAADWRTAEEITAAFRSVSPEDPVRYDFALTRIGILKECTALRRGNCDRCAVASLCAKKAISPGRF